MSALLNSKCLRLRHANPATLLPLCSREFALLRHTKVRGSGSAESARGWASQSYLRSQCSGSVQGSSNNFAARRQTASVFSNPVGPMTALSRPLPTGSRRYQHSQVEDATSDIDHAPIIASYPEFIKPQDTLPRRHIGPSDEDITAMLKSLNQPDLDAFIRQTIPDSIRASKKFTIPSEQTPETEMLDELTKAGKANSAAEVDTYIGMGYHPTITPGVIKRNVLENPGWYTSYTPYQPEISQGTFDSRLH
jgi:Glycine cleavage system P-protein